MIAARGKPFHDTRYCRRAGALGDPLVQDLLDLVLLPLPRPSGLLALTSVAAHSASRSQALPLLRLGVRRGEIQDQIDGGGQQELAVGVGVVHPLRGEGLAALAAPRPLPDLGLLEYPSSEAQDAQLCKMDGLRKMRKVSLRARRELQG